MIYVFRFVYMVLNGILFNIQLGDENINTVYTVCIVCTQYRKITLVYMTVMVMEMDMEEVSKELWGWM